MAATNTQMILLCMGTLVFFNLAIGVIEDDDHCPLHDGTAKECNQSNQSVSDIEKW